MTQIEQLRDSIRKAKNTLGNKSVPESLKSKIKIKIEQLQKSLTELEAAEERKAEAETAAQKAKAQQHKNQVVAKSKSLVKATSNLTALQKLVKTNKKYATYKGSGIDLKKDAQEGAFAVGRRVSKGLKSNQFGDSKDNKGHVYYEYRANRLDVKQPKKQQRYPKLEHGGELGDKYASGGEVRIIETKFNSHKSHNPYTDILEGKIDKDSFMTYYVNVKGENIGKEGMEYYSGENYVGGSNKRSVSRNYSVDEIPSKYKKAWDKLKLEYNEKHKSHGGYMAKGGMVEHGLEVGDFIDSFMDDLIFVKNNGDNFMVDLNHGTRKKLDYRYTFADGGYMDNGIKFDYKLIVQPDFKYKNTANKFLEDNPKDSLVYKLAVLLIRGKKNPDEILNIKSERQYASLLRKLEKISGESSHEMAWRTESYSLADAEEWTRDSLSNVYYVHSEHNKMADGGYMAKGGKTTDEPMVTRGFSDDEAYEYAKGGMTKAKAEQIKKEYDENEDNNLHSENVVLLAEHFGTKDELRDAKTILAKHEAMGSIPKSLYEERYILSEKLYDRMIDALKK